MFVEHKRRIDEIQTQPLPIELLAKSQEVRPRPREASLPNVNDEAMKPGAQPFRG